jgi:hypothetical protein
MGIIASTGFIYTSCHPERSRRIWLERINSLCLNFLFFLKSRFLRQSVPVVPLYAVSFWLPFDSAQSDRQKVYRFHQVYFTKGCASKHSEEINIHFYEEPPS